MNIVCSLTWGVALIGGILYWAWLTLYGTTFQVQGVHRRTALSRSRDCEEGRHVALINPFVKSAWNKLVLTCILQTVLNVMFAYFQLKYG